MWVFIDCSNRSVKIISCGSTSLEPNMVLLREMFLSSFDDLRQVQHRDGGGRIRLRQLAGKSTSATWEMFTT